MKATINTSVNLAMIPAFAACGVTGLLKMPELAIAWDGPAYEALSFVHDWSGIAGLALVGLHLVLHARWFTRIIKGMAHRPGARKASARLGGAVARVGAWALAFALLAALPSEAWARGHHANNATVPQGISWSAGSLKDGVWKGSASGYMPSLQVEVTVKNGAIAGVRVVSHQETPRWWMMVANIMPARIVQAQSTAVDAVGGATASSWGIMSAVENALAQARR